MMDKPPLNQSLPVGTLKPSVHIATTCVCTTLIMFVMVLGSFGNGQVLLSGIQNKKMRCNFDLLIMNLASVDFLMCTVLAPVFLYLLFTTHSSPFALCGGMQFLGMMCGILSLETMDVIAIHRQTRVIRQIKGKLTTLQALVILILLWLVSIGVSSAALVHLVSYWPSDSSTCLPIINGPNRVIHNVILFYMGPVCVLSFIIIVLSYTVIAYAVQKQSRVKRCPSAVSRPCPSPVLKNTQGYYENRPNHHHHHNQQRKVNIEPGAANSPGKTVSLQVGQFAMDKESKAMTMCLVVTVTVLLCWVPLITSQVIEFFRGESLVLYQVKICGIALVFLNSALDPYVYAQHNSQLKQKTSRLYHAVVTCQCACTSLCYNNKQTMLTTAGKGNLEVNRNKSSHMDPDTNTLQIVSPKQGRKMHMVDQAVGPSNTLGHRAFTPNSPNSMKGTLTIQTSPTRPQRTVTLPNGDCYVYSVQIHKSPVKSSYNSRKSYARQSSYVVPDTHASGPPAAAIL